MTLGCTASMWKKVINTRRAVPPGRAMEEVTRSVARKNTKQVWERFLPFPAQWDFSSLVNPVRRHWHWKWEEDGNSERRGTCDASPFLPHDCERLGSTQSSSVWLHLGCNTCCICFPQFPVLWTDHTGWAKQREKTFGTQGLITVVGDFAVTARETHKPRSGSLLGRQLESHNFLAARLSHLSVVLWTSFQVRKEGASSKKKKKMHSVSNFQGPDIRLKASFNPTIIPLRWPLFHMSISRHREVQ